MCCPTGASARHTWKPCWMPLPNVLPKIASRSGARKSLTSSKTTPVRAETLIVLATGVAAADDKITGAEKALLNRFAAELGVGEQRLSEVLEELTSPSKNMPAGK